MITVNDQPIDQGAYGNLVKVVEESLEQVSVKPEIKPELQQIDILGTGINKNFTEPEFQRQELTRYKENLVDEKTTYKVKPTVRQLETIRDMFPNKKDEEYVMNVSVIVEFIRTIPKPQD